MIGGTITQDYTDIFNGMVMVSVADKTSALIECTRTSGSISAREFSGAVGNISAGAAIGSSNAGTNERGRTARSTQLSSTSQMRFLGPEVGVIEFSNTLSLNTRSMHVINNGLDLSSSGCSAVSSSICPVRDLFRRNGMMDAARFLRAANFYSIFFLQKRGNGRWVVIFLSTLLSSPPLLLSPLLCHFSCSSSPFKPILDFLRYFQHCV